MHNAWPQRLYSRSNTHSIIGKLTKISFSLPCENPSLKERLRVHSFDGKHGTSSSSDQRNGSTLCIAHDEWKVVFGHTETENYWWPATTWQPRGIKPPIRPVSAIDPSPQLSHRMPWFKKSRKSRQPSKQPASLGIPTHIAAGPLGFGATLDLGIYPKGTLHLTEVQQPMGLIWPWL